MKVGREPSDSDAKRIDVSIREAYRSWFLDDVAKEKERKEDGNWIGIW